MKQVNFKPIFPHLVAVALFLVIAVVYCLPVFQGMVVHQHDMLGTRGMTQQSIEFFEKYGYYPLWTNSMFSGMPTFQTVSYTHLRAHETPEHLVCRLLLE